jgi:hydroxymethylpyrimidine pyrophosphatase-like HAD family hydrolase
MRIAIDFDGTIVEDKYPGMGRELPHAIGILKQLQKNGHHLILWTHRSGYELEEAVNFCKSKRLEFYTVNKNYPGEIVKSGAIRKIRADLFIDNHNLGGMLNWTEMFWMIQLQMVS